MYEITIANETYEMVDFQEINNMLKKVQGSRAEFWPGFSQVIDKFYKESFLKKDKSYIENELYRLQLLINDCFVYLLKGKENFEEYFERKLSEKKSMDKEALKNHKIDKNIFFDSEEIGLKLNTYEMDKLDLFYYYSFTNFYLLEYLIEAIVMLPLVFKPGKFNEDELRTLNAYLTNIFSVDYSESFKYFEAKLK